MLRFIAYIFLYGLVDANIMDNDKDLMLALLGRERHLMKEITSAPSLDEVPLSAFPEFETESEQFFRIVEENNIFASRKGIDTPDGNKTIGFGPHLITQEKSIGISKFGAITSHIATAALEFVTTHNITVAEHRTTTPDPRDNVAFTKQAKPTQSFTTLRGRKKRQAKHILQDVDRVQIDNFLRKLPFPSEILQNTDDIKCPYQAPIKCDTTAKYRTIDGSCNNLDYPYWGKSFTPFDRFLYPDYDGIGEPCEKGKFDIPLPGPRVISNKVHTQSVIADLDPPLSYFTMQFGQFLDHDITKTALSKGSYPNFNLQCCNPNRPTSPDCFSFAIPDDDPYYGAPSGSKRRCMNMVRSVGTVDLDCKFGYREQLNELTHYIDGSAVYGSRQVELVALKDPSNNGKLLVSDLDRLPLDEHNNAGCNSNLGQNCFRAGDVRVNVQPGLISLHTIFVREHNRIAQYFIDHPDCYNWDGRQIFEETRRYIAAEIQYITYNEFLPKLISERMREDFDLIPLSTGYYTGYDPTIRPMIRNSFATAAYRMGHSLLRDKFFFDRQASDLHKHFNNPDLIYKPQGIEKCTRGLYEQPAQGIDEKLTREVTWKLFETIAGHGDDLAAINIQRGRDHGLPPYTTWLHWCTGKDVEPQNFEPGQEGGLLFHSENAAAKLKSTYTHTCDIDLFPGAMSEDPLPGGRLGPTFTCILALQFRALKQGDRFFYEGNTPSNPHHFSPEELDGFRPITMAKIICENTNLDQIPRDVFLEPSDSNPYVNCSDLPDICFPKNGNWSEWKPTPSGCCCQIQEYRTCDYPAPNKCGKPCEGYDFRYKKQGCCCHSHHDEQPQR